MNDRPTCDEISRLSRLVFQIWRGTDRQTGDRQTDATTETEGSDIYSVRA